MVEAELSACICFVTTERRVLVNSTVAPTSQPRSDLGRSRRYSQVLVSAVATLKEVAEKGPQLL